MARYSRQQASSTGIILGCAKVNRASPAGCVHGSQCLNEALLASADFSACMLSISLKQAAMESQYTEHRFHHTFGYGDTIPCPYPTVTAAFFHQVARIPSKLAVRDLSGPLREVTYHELAQHSQVLASHLRTLGVLPHHRVPLVAKRGLEMIVGIWAILSCGAQYVPLDGTVVPDFTIRHVVEQSRSQIVLCILSTSLRLQNLCPELTQVIIGNLPPVQEILKDTSPMDFATADSGCYAIYTSGSLPNLFPVPTTAC